LGLQVFTDLALDRIGGFLGRGERGIVLVSQRAPTVANLVLWITTGSLERLELLLEAAVLRSEVVMALVHL
jgi:hypothetical protein